MSEDKKSEGFNINSFITGSEDKKNVNLPIVAELVPTLPAVPKTSRKRTKKTDGETTTLTATPTAKTSMDYISQNVPYEQSYQESEAMLNEVIAQANSISLDLMGDLQMLRASKVLKNKNIMINATTENLIAAMQAKLAAIRDKTKIRDKVHDLELKRVKDLKIDTIDGKSDEQKIAEMYNAFISTNIGTNPMTQLGPTPINMMMNPTAYPTQQQISIGEVNESAQWESTLTPAQKRMLLSAQNTLNIVVLYDEATGNRRFAALDANTGQEIPGVELPGESPYDLDLNPMMRTAKSKRLQIVYPLVIIQSQSMSAY